MKKKIVCITIASILTLSPISVFADEKDDRIAELEVQVEELQMIIEELEEKLEKYEGNESGIEKFLLEKNVLNGDKIEMAGDMVGAISGFKYGNAEIYEYDTESEEYKKLESGEGIPLDGFDGVILEAISVNNGYVLMGEASDELVAAFEEFEQK